MVQGAALSANDPRAAETGNGWLMCRRATEVGVKTAEGMTVSAVGDGSAPQRIKMISVGFRDARVQISKARTKLDIKVQQKLFILRRQIWSEGSNPLANKIWLGRKMSTRRLCKTRFPGRV
jgi:hypothetical protein